MLEKQEHSPPRLLTVFNQKFVMGFFSPQDWYFWMPYCSLGLIILFTVVFALGPGKFSIKRNKEIESCELINRVRKILPYIP